MKARLALFALAAGSLCAQTPSSSPTFVRELEISADEKPATNAAPRMRERVNLGETPGGEAAFEIKPPADSPNPEKVGEITGPLPGEQPVPQRPPVTGTVDVTAKNNNMLVRAATGNLVRIALESNPGTGYNWELRGFDPSAAEFYAADLVPRSGGNVLMGAPGDTVITLQAVKPGKQRIDLIYRRPWEPIDRAEGSFGFDLEVTGAAPPPPTPTPSPAK